MNSNIRIAQEMLRIAKDLVAVSDFSKRNNFNKSTGLKLNQSQFKSVRESLADEEESASNDMMDKVAEELLQVASELLKNEEE